MESDIRIRCRKISIQPNLSLNVIIILIFSILNSFTSTHVLASNVLRPRGVSLSMSSFYDPSKSFACFDGSGTISFKHVNDDYCDCRDGSDEPGTAACSNGVFHCNNIGHIGQDISSTFVNDGVCDCCDTSDEYASDADCVDTCYVMGEAAREESRRSAEIQLEGYNIRLKMAEEGVNIKKEKQARIEELLKEKLRAEAEQAEKLSLKDAAESLEKESLEQYKAIEEEINAKKEKERKEKDEYDAREAFNHLDEDDDGFITIQELQAKEIFDTNRDGEVSEDEAKFYLQQNESMDIETFLTSGWALIKPTYLHHKRLFIPPSQVELTPEEEHTPPRYKDVEELHEEPEKEEDENEFEQQQEEEAEEEEEEEETEEYADELDEAAALKEKEEADNENEIQYDPETQRLIDIANAARDDFKTADDQLKDIVKEIQSLQDGLDKDFGPNDEFRVLEGRCYEFTDREYTYKLCPFDSAVQKPKNGHGETRLGSWGTWTGSAGNPYSAMKYTGGQGCWNGPQRSAEVMLSCGIENALTAVSEPNRCEYLFLFTSPAVCTQSEDADKIHYQHSEL